MGQNFNGKKALEEIKKVKDDLSVKFKERKENINKYKKSINLKEKNNKKLNKYSLFQRQKFILVKIEYSNNTGAIFSFYNFDFTDIKNILIKDILNDKYLRIQKKDVYSYYVEDKYLYLKLKDNTKLKIRFIN